MCAICCLDILTINNSVLNHCVDFISIKVFLRITVLDSLAADSVTIFSFLLFFQGLM